jgi:hypothetical protein
VTAARLVLVIAALLLFTDYQYGNGRLVQFLSDQAVDAGYKLNSAFSQLLHRVAP